MDASSWLPGAIFAGGVIDFVIRLLALIYVPRNRRPQTAMAWLLVIFLLPSYIGVPLFVLLGSRRLPKNRRDKQSEISAFIRESTVGVDEEIHDHPTLDPLVALNRNLGAMPLAGGNSATLLNDYDATLEAMTAEINGAKQWVHVEFYILSFDATTAPFFDALEAAVKRGVTVRVLLDHVAGLRATGYRRTLRRLRKAGVLWSLMLPVQPLRGKWQRPDLRNHRKILVVDGAVAFTGSQNVIDSSYNKRGNVRRGLHWKDLMVRFEGPIVAGINALFITDWYSETDEFLSREADVLPKPRPYAATTLDAQVVPSGPGFQGENNLRMFNSLIYMAQERLMIASPYFVPDESMLYAITTAAQSGIDVQLFVSEIGDQPLVYHAQRSYYEQLLSAGVRIWLYKAPTVLHTKFVTVDDDIAVIGSSNMDMRSFSLNLEISVMVHGKSFVDDLRKVEQSYRDMSRELFLDDWMERPRAGKVLDSIARLTAAVQ